ncbi:hypothetical protein OIO90_005760 [Microbotryomycetes sp. JL221]|nr:hypothetical protein OIO90_005760 [Microbotryomycetes sp. JL221]
MAPLAIPHGEHPDGDPFAEQDRQAYEKSQLGQLEARWQRVEQQNEAAAGPDHKPKERARVTPRMSTGGSPKRKRVVRGATLDRAVSAHGEQDEDQAVDDDKKSDAESVVAEEEDIGSTSEGDEDDEDDEDGDDDDEDNESADEKQVAAQMIARHASKGQEADDDDDENEEDEASGDSGDEQGDERNPTEGLGEDDSDLAMMDGDRSMQQHDDLRTRSPSLSGDVPVEKRDSHTKDDDKREQHDHDMKPSLSRADSSTSLTSLDSGRPSSPARPHTDKAPQIGTASERTGHGSAKLVSTTSNEVHKSRKTHSIAGTASKPKPTFAKQQGTIRLEIQLPAPGSTAEVPKFSIVNLAQAAGFIQMDEDNMDKQNEDGSGDSDVSENEGQKNLETGEAGKNNGDAPPPKKKRKRGKNVVLGRWGGYDVDDPFVDDSELSFYEPKYYVPPKRRGFFVCSGEVEVERKNRRGRVAGSKNKPKNTDPTERSQTPGADKASSLPAFSGPSVKKREGFSPELQEKLENLKAEVAKESFEVKSKFPPRLKPILVDVALTAVDLGEFDDDFLAMLPKIFPYNLFTMKKLVKREIYPHRVERLQAEIEKQMAILKEGVDVNYAKQKAEYAQALEQWKADYAQYERDKANKPEGTWIAPDANKANGVSQGTPEPGAVPSLAAVAGTPVHSTGPDGRTSTPQDSNAEDPDAPVRPKWKFRLNEAMRFAVLRMVDCDEEISNLTIEKQNLEKATEKGEKPHSTMIQRKALYSRIVDLWEPGDITSNQLSREMSQVRNKLKRKAE